MVIFTAAWSEASDRFVATTLEAPEAVGVISACFETVRLDVDSHPEIARRMQVTRIPMACVMDANERLLFQFECSDSSADFVTYAARAIQHAAAAKGAMPPQSVVPTAIPSAMPPSPASPAIVYAPAQRPIEPWASQPAPQSSPWVEGRAGYAPPAQPVTSYPAAAYPGTERGFAAAPSVAVQAAIPAEPPPVFPGLAPSLPATPPATSYPITQNPDAAAIAGAEKKSRNPFTAFSNSVAAIFKPATAKKDEAVGATATAQRPSPPSTATVATLPPVVPGAGSPGLNGYCPVTLADKRAWVAGQSQWGVTHRGRTYLFAGPAEQQAFLASPDRYAPALAGDDPVVAIDAGRQVSGDLRFGLTFQSRLYLFSSRETLDAFVTAPEKYVRGVAIAERPVSPAPGSFVR